jgi:hypothetical protein
VIFVGIAAYVLARQGRATASSGEAAYWSQHRHLNLESWLSDATEDDISFVPQALFGLAQLDLQLRQAPAAEVLQLHALEVLPDPLLGV